VRLHSDRSGETGRHRQTVAPRSALGPRASRPARGRRLRPPGRRGIGGATGAPGRGERFAEIAAGVVSAAAGMPFSSFGLDAMIVRATRELGFTRPTPVQQEAIPLAMAGRDVLACAMTGSGKTAAFLLPIMQRLLAKRRGTTRALVLTPTREL